MGDRRSDIVRPFVDSRPPAVKRICSKYATSDMKTSIKHEYVRLVSPFPYMLFQCSVLSLPLRPKVAAKLFKRPLSRDFSRTCKVDLLKSPRFFEKVAFRGTQTQSLLAKTSSFVSEKKSFKKSANHLSDLK